MAKLLDKYKNSKKYPYEESVERINGYSYYNKLLAGEHFDAFALKGDRNFTIGYAKLRYVVCNFAGLVSKVSADFLFGKEAHVIAEKNKEWIEELFFKNKMRTKCYESSITNSALGDSVFRVRAKDNEIVIEEISPDIYFPHIYGEKIKAQPNVEEIAWIQKDANIEYLLREIHGPGFIEIKAYVTDSGKIDKEIEIEEYNKIFGTNYKKLEATNIPYNLIVHIPNYRLKRGYFGTSDYLDIDELVFALNNRMTKIENILDKHSDPILAIPEGVLDEDGRVKRESLTMFEMDSEGNKPEYIVWNASLESAFKEVDKIVEMMLLFSETNPDVFGLSKGSAAESGRALRMRLIRTIAKTFRKQLYYRQGLQEISMIAQELAKANGYTVMGKKISGDIEIPEVKFGDGVVVDERDVVETESIKLENGTTSKKRAIMRQEDVNESEADDIIEEIKSQDSVDIGGFRKFVMDSGEKINEKGDQQ